MAKNKALFLDRDGIINKIIARDDKQTSPRSFEEFELTPGIKEILKEFKNRGFLNIIITSQPEVERGLVTKEEIDKMHDFIKDNLLIDDLLVCFHDDYHNCDCRKPKPGLFFGSAKKWDVDLSKSFMLGDTHKDIRAGRSAGVKTILIDTFYNQEVQPDYRIKNFGEIFNLIEK